MGRDQSRNGDGALGSKAAKAAALFQAAVRAFESGKLADAERACRQVLDDFPDNASALHLLGVLAWRTGHLADAQQLIARALTQSPGDADAQNSMGCVLVELNQPAQAVQAFDAALRSRPAYPSALANRGHALLKLGHAEEAITSARKAVALQPNHFDAWTHIGNGSLALGRMGEAVSAFERALALRPDHAGAHINLGRAASEQGHVIRAEAEFRRAVELAPGAFEAHLGLADVLRKSGQFAAASAVYEKALRLAPDDRDALAGLADAQLLSGFADKALGTYALALERHPHTASIHLGIGGVHMTTGRRDQAIAELNTALRLDPNLFPAVAALMEMQEPRAGDPLVERIEALLRRGKVPETKDRILLHFALGKTLLKESDPSRAFAHLNEGNRLKRARFDFSIERHEQHMAEVARQFPADLFRRLSGTGAPSELPLFILGMPRSGTSLVEQILASHPDVQGAGELLTLNRAIHAVASAPYPDFMAAADAPLLSRLGEAYLAEIAPLALGRARLIDKLPGNFLKTGLIALALPGARIVHCRRDPVDTCLSCYSTDFTEAQPFTCDQTELGRYWRAYDSLMTHWRSVLPPDRFLEVQYEEVVADLENQARRLVAFTGLPWNDACLAFHKTERVVHTASAMQVQQPIYTRSVRRWVRFAPYLQPLLKALEVSAPEL